MSKINLRKTVGLLIGASLFVATSLFFAYAWYQWQSGETLVTFNINDSYFYCESGMDVEITDYLLL